MVIKCTLKIDLPAPLIDFILSLPDFRIGSLFLLTLYHNELKKNSLLPRLGVIGYGKGIFFFVCLKVHCEIVSIKKETTFWNQGVKGYNLSKVQANLFLRSSWIPLNSPVQIWHILSVWNPLRKRWGCRKTCVYAHKDTCDQLQLQWLLTFFSSDDFIVFLRRKNHMHTPIIKIPDIFYRCFTFDIFSCRMFFKSILENASNQVWHCTLISMPANYKATAWFIYNFFWQQIA